MDRASAADIFKLYQFDLLKFLESKFGCGQSSGDIAQEAFLRMIQVEPASSIRDPRAFLFTVAANIARDRQRHGQRWRSVEFERSSHQHAALVSPPLDRIVSGHEELQRLEQAVSELPAKCRMVFILLRVEGLNHREIAELMNLSETMVRKYAARALAYCHARLDEGTR